MDDEDIGDGKQIIDDSPQIFPYIDPDEINASSYIVINFNKYLNRFS